MSVLVGIITGETAAVRDRSLDSFCRSASVSQLLAECAELEAFRRTGDNLYEQVRALFFLYAIHRFHLPAQTDFPPGPHIPYAGYELLLKRRFGEAIDAFLAMQTREGPGDGISSALAAAYHSLGFQCLADQVRHSVRAVPGNHWMFRTGHPADYPLRVRGDLCRQTDGLFPILHEATPVRMDLSHSAWSDIFFLGMDFPEGARVLNISVDLSVSQRDEMPPPRPPVEASFRIIDRPVLRLVSVDLETTAEIDSLAEVFDFARDYLGLLKAAVIAAGIVPPGMEGAAQPLSDLLAKLVGPGKGIELVSQVNGIPKGSRLAVSTNLLACLISVCMRATDQISALTNGLEENDRRLISARAILGEWLAGSGGGWQDSGGIWPGMKLIQGAVAQEGDPEYGVSRGRLLPTHEILSTDRVPEAARRALQDSLVLVHGGMAQDVGPILEMVTEKYLLRSEAEWQGRQEAMRLLDEIVDGLEKGDTAAIGGATQRNFAGPLQTIIPWVSNLYTETLIERVEQEFGTGFQGFWMLGGMSGGGMGFIFDPDVKPAAQQRLSTIMSEVKTQFADAIPFAMEPVVYNFAINERGSWADLATGSLALMSPGYYAQTVPEWVRRESLSLSPALRTEFAMFGARCRSDSALAMAVPALLDRLLPAAPKAGDDEDDLQDLLARYGFDRQQHEEVRANLRSGRIGLAQNRLPISSRIEDVAPGDVADATQGGVDRFRDAGLAALRHGEVAVVTMAGGVGSRWTQGGGIVKALNPFARLGGKHRTFIEVHLAKSRRSAELCGTPLPHVITTSYLTDGPTETFLLAQEHYRYSGPLHLSPGRHIGLRMVPMARDLRFAWEEMPQQQLDEQAQKVRQSLQAALIDWAQQTGEGSDYTDNLPRQCLHPVGHWYEVSNLLGNGVLSKLLQERPQLQYLMVHNVDTVGADVDPALLGHHIEQSNALTFEVITRRIEDRGGGLARVDGRPRLVEGLALPRDDVEFELTYYNTNTTWVSIDRLLEVFGLTRTDLDDERLVSEAVRCMAARMPTYVTLKDVKKRWGHGQEDVFPVVQFEKLWGDMTMLPDLPCGFVAVPRVRGQQLKEAAQLDGWLRDGSAAYLEEICDWG
jgi:hypothetical protein